MAFEIEDERDPRGLARFAARALGAILGAATRVAWDRVERAVLDPDPDDVDPDDPRPEEQAS